MINICFLRGKVNNNIDLQFVYGSKKVISIVKLELLLDDGQTVCTYGYNEMADFIYRNIVRDDIIFIKGKIVKNNVEIDEIFL